MPPSSALRAASPLKGEAVTCANLTHSTASPLRGEAARRADEGVYSLSLDITLPKIRSSLKDEAVTFANLTHSTASPLRGEAERSSDEGVVNLRCYKFKNIFPPKITN